MIIIGSYLIQVNPEPESECERRDNRLCVLHGKTLPPAQICYGDSAQCAVRKVYFSAQPNKLKHILNFEKYYPIEHIFVPACSSARKIHFFKF